MIIIRKFNYDLTDGFIGDAREGGEKRSLFRVGEERGGGGGEDEGEGEEEGE